VRAGGRGVVGRDSELAVLREALADVARGRGRAVLVEGEPGIGKSALLETALDEVPSGVGLIRGACAEWGRRYVLTAVISALDAVPDGLAAPHPSPVRTPRRPRSAASSNALPSTDRSCTPRSRAAARTTAAGSSSTRPRHHSSPACLRTSGLRCASCAAARTAASAVS
jgi:hypothetical protein